MLKVIAVIAASCALAFGAPGAAGAQTRSAAGIPLDAPWKVTIYQFARKHFIHPAWGWQHSERNYLVSLELARGDGLKVDRDVLFAASFLHDMAAFKPWAMKGMEHGARAAQTSVAILRSAGFPMAKLPLVQAAERGHMFYSKPGSSPEAIVFHDADSLDFLGSVGVARSMALLGEQADGFGASLSDLRDALRSIPPKILTRTGKAMAARRAAELRRFLHEVDSETFGRKAT